VGNPKTAIKGGNLGRKTEALLQTFGLSGFANVLTAVR